MDCEDAFIHNNAAGGLRLLRVGWLPAKAIGSEDNSTLCNLNIFENICTTNLAYSSHKMD